MKFTINNEEYELIYSFRSNIYFEQISGHTMDLNNLSANDLITLFYCIVISTLQKNKRPVITMLDFLDAVDDNGGEKCILEFSEWYVEVMKAQYEVLDTVVGDDKKQDIDLSKKK